jgi:chorismate synthase
MPPQAMVAEIKEAAKEGDSLGGSSRPSPTACPSDWGATCTGTASSTAALAQAVMSIQAVKGVEIGDGFEVAGRRGSAAHDPVTCRTDEHGYERARTLAGGVEGGISTGEPVVVRAAMKPLATLNRPTLATVDTATKEAGVSFKERTDVTAVPALGVVVEHMVALVLANEATRKFGGDSVGRTGAQPPRLGGCPGGRSCRCLTARPPQPWCWWA